MVLEGSDESSNYSSSYLASESIEFTKTDGEDDEEVSQNDTSSESSGCYDSGRHSINDMEVDKCEKEMTEEDELCVLKDALEAVTSFQGLSQYQKNLMFQNLKNLGAETKKELIDGWKELNAEVLRLNAKKHSFFAKFSNAGV